MRTNNFGDRMMSIRRHSIHLSLLALCARRGAAAADAPGDKECDAGVETAASSPPLP
jgi:hypothetical protein